MNDTQNRINSDTQYEKFQKLSAEDKAEFVSRILGKDSGLSVVVGSGCFGNATINNSTFVHLQSMDLATVAQLMDAIAKRIAAEAISSVSAS